MLFDLLAQMTLSEQGPTKEHGLPQQRAHNRHITAHEYAGVLDNQEDYSDENETHLHCK